MRLISALILLLALLAPQNLSAAIGPDEVLSDPVLEQRARDLTRQLRCLVCQNQAIDDSNAELARDLRLLVRARLTAGDSDADVLAFMTARYGDFVLLRPPVRPGTYLLWFGPAAVLLLAGTGVALYLRRRRGEPPAPLSPDERARLDALLAGEDADRRG